MNTNSLKSNSNTPLPPSPESKLDRRPKIEGMIHDPIEKSEKYLLIEKELEEKLQLYFDEKVGEDVAVSPEEYWAVMKQVLKDDYQIDWKSPAELTPLLFNRSIFKSIDVKLILKRILIVIAILFVKTVRVVNIIIDVLFTERMFKRIMGTCIVIGSVLFIIVMVMTLYAIKDKKSNSYSNPLQENFNNKKDTFLTDTIFDKALFLEDEILVPQMIVKDDLVRANNKYKSIANFKIFDMQSDSTKWLFDSGQEIVDYTLIENEKRKVLLLEFSNGFYVYSKSNLPIVKIEYPLGFHLVFASSEKTEDSEDDFYTQFYKEDKLLISAKNTSGYMYWVYEWKDGGAQVLPITDTIWKDELKVVDKNISPDMDRKDSLVISKLINYGKVGNAKALAGLFIYPIERRYPLPAIKDSAEFVRYCPIIFDDSLKRVLSRTSVADWKSYGWRGWYLDVFFWAEGFGGGRISRIDYFSAKEKALWKNLAKKEIRTLHPSMREEIDKPILTFRSEQGEWTGRIDLLKSEKYRLALYKQGTKLSALPDFMETDSLYEIQGSMANEYFVFRNDSVRVEVLWDNSLAYTDFLRINNFLRIVNRQESKEYISQYKYWLDLIKY